MNKANYYLHDCKSMAKCNLQDLSIFRLVINKYIRGESKKFVDFVNKIKSTYAISLKLPYVCDQFNTNKHRKFQTNHLSVQLTSFLWQFV